MRFYNICIEGPDCSGKTTLYNKLHKTTNFAYNIQDRSFLSMYVHSKFYNRDDVSFWYDKLHENLKALNTLYVVIVPNESVLIERLKNRGDEFQNEKSLLEIRNIFFEISKFYLGFLPNVIFTESDDVEYITKIVLGQLDYLNSLGASDLIRSFVMNSHVNEVTNISCEEIVNIDNLDYDVLNFPQEKEYYEKIISSCILKIQKELMGLNEYNVPQKLDSRRFIYTDDSCISMIHVLWRSNQLEVNVVMRSSNVSKTLWADYEFMKILSYYIAKELNVEESIINLKLNIRSAHIVP